MLISANFREVRLGAIEGLTREEIDQKFGAHTFDHWTSLEEQNFNFAFPEGENTWQAIERFHNGLIDLIQEYEFSTAALCTHGLIMRRFLHSLRPDLTEPLSIPNCAVFKIEWDRRNRHFKII